MGAGSSCCSSAAGLVAGQPSTGSQGAGQARGKGAKATVWGGVSKVHKHCAPPACCCCCCCSLLGSPGQAGALAQATGRQQQGAGARGSCAGKQGTDPGPWVGPGSQAARIPAVLLCQALLGGLWGGSLLCCWGQHALNHARELFQGSGHKGWPGGQPLAPWHARGVGVYGVREAPLQLPVHGALPLSVLPSGHKGSASVLWQGGSIAGLPQEEEGIGAIPAQRAIHHLHGCDGHARQPVTGVLWVQLLGVWHPPKALRPKVQEDL